MARPKMEKCWSEELYRKGGTTSRARSPGTVCGPDAVSQSLPAVGKSSRGEERGVSEKSGLQR